ncbi:MAG TPA: SDR family oxidoreductase [Symbiobacteriaceae bacterium]|jgi:NAD(P)-dependent dehydrogenase (short-subunit alcohol dehydrogenase family)
MTGNLANMEGKLCLITGSTSGIGRETALALARLGAHVVLVARDQQKGEATVADIKAQTGNSHVDLLLADLSVQASVRQLADEFISRYGKLDVLVNNAGALLGKRRVSKDGLEYTFALNHLNYFLLTNLLLDRLKASARIINVASEASRMGGDIDFSDLNLADGYSSWKAYGRSKLANILFTYELARRLEGTGVTVNAMHPGGVATNFGTGNNAFMNAAMKLVRPFMLTPAQGADTVVYLAASPAVEGVTGKYWAKRKPIPSKPVSYDEVVAKRLWQASVKLTGLAK